MEENVAGKVEGKVEGNVDVDVDVDVDVEENEEGNETVMIMRKIIYILPLIMVLVAVSCEKGNEGTDGPGGTDSVIRFPSGSEYAAGDDVIIICTGISSEAVLYLVSPDGSQTLVGNPTITASGIFFTLDVPAGDYTVVVEQSGERVELGNISVTAASIDIIVNEVPSYCLPGDSFTVEGLDFDESAELVIVSADGTRTSLRTEATSTSLTAQVPDDAPRGKMQLLIVQDDGEMTVSETFFVTTRKLLTGVVYTIGVGNATYEHSYELHPERDGSGEIVGFTEYGMSSSDGADGTVYSFDPVSGDFGYSDFEMTVRNGQVASVRFETTQGGEEGYYTFEWEYASDGFLSYAVGSGSAYGTLFLGSEDGNLSLDDLAIECDYSDETLVNNPFAPDFVLGILAADNEQLRVAQVMGLTGTVSAMLPASIDGNAVTYVYDDEGYVTEAAYTDPYTSFETEIKYTYE